MEETSFGAWLRRQRRMMDLTQQELAGQVGCARITLRRIEAGELKPSKELAAILLDRLGIPPNGREAWVRFARGVDAMPGAKPSSPAPPPKTNLPASLTRFIGRTAELAEVSILLEQYRLVTLAGPGGVGKTRLGLEVGSRYLDQAEGGAWFVEMAPLGRPDLVPQALATALGIQPAPGLPLEDLLANHFRLKKALLIFDNCEHLLDPIAHLVAFLLKRCPGLQALATSREPLGILGEAVYRVPAMDFPGEELDVRAESSFDSIRLFEARARMAGSGFALTEENMADVVRICKMLDGIPLAIELAAGRVGQFSPAEISIRLETDLLLLAGGNRTALPRQQTIRESIAWSWRLLAPSEQVIFRRLGVFNGGWTLEAARAVCGEEEEPDEIVGRLVEKSLVNLLQGAGEKTRYGFHLVVRQFALEKLAEAGEAGTIRRRHLEFYTAVVETADDSLHGPDQQRLLVRLEAEQPNLRAALEAALDQDQIRAIRLAAGMGWYWFRRGLAREGGAWFDQVLALPAAANRDPRNLETSASLVKVYFGAGLLAHFRGEYMQARTFLEKSQVLALHLEEPVGVARARRLLGMGAIWLGDFGGAVQHFEESLGLLRGEDSPWDLSETLNARGFLLAALGRTETARAALEESLQLARANGDRYGMGMPLANLGSLEYQHGNLDKGQALLEESLAIGLEVGDPTITSWAQKELGHLAMARGDLMNAASQFEAVLASCRETNYQSGVAEMLRALADVAMRQMAFADARSRLEESVAISLQQGDVRNLLFCAFSLSALAAAENRWPGAVQLLGLFSAQASKIGAYLPPITREAFKKLEDSVREAIEPGLFDAYWSAGTGMNLPDGLAQALHA